MENIEQLKEMINLLEMENSKLNEVHIVMRERVNKLTVRVRELEEQIREMLLNNKHQD